MTRTLALSILLLAPVALAQTEEGPAPAPAQARTGPQPVRVTTFELLHPGIDEQLLVPVMRALDDGLKRNSRLEMKALDTRLADFAQEVPQEQIDQGRVLSQEGQKALASLELGTAIKKLTQAVDVLSKVLPYIKKAELADAMMALGAAYFENVEKKEAKATFTRLLTWRNDYTVDVNKFAPPILAIVQEVKKELERAKRGSIEIRSEPAGAQAYVDGKYVGLTPTFGEGLIVGEHWVTLKKEAYRKAVMPAQASAKAQQLVSVTLERSAKYLLVQQALEAVEKSLGAPTLDSSADNLKEVLFIDHAVFVRASPASPGYMKVDSLLYDLRTRRRLTRVTKTVSNDHAEKQLATLAQALYLNVSYDVELVERRDAPPPKPKTRAPFYKSWWFWTAAGAVTAGVVLAATLAPRPKDCGGGSFCFGVVY